MRGRSNSLAPQPEWMMSVKPGDVLQEKRSGALRVVRKVTRDDEGRLRFLSMVIRRCSWTHRPYTYLYHVDVRARLEPVGAAVDMQSSLDRKIDRCITDPNYRGLDCCDVRGGGMTQLSLTLEPREEGERAGEACTAKAERVADFDREGAKRFILGWLRKHGRMSGELATDAAIAQGFRPHDQRAFGGLYRALAHAKEIRCVGFCERQKGHGTSGARTWEAVQ